MRPKEVAVYLSISESMVLILHRRGELVSIRIPGQRSRRYTTESVVALANRWLGEKGESE